MRLKKINIDQILNEELEAMPSNRGNNRRRTRGNHQSVQKENSPQYVRNGQHGRDGKESEKVEIDLCSSSAGSHVVLDEDE